MIETLKAYLDLARIHFFFVWPILFCSGLFLAFETYGGFSWTTVIQAILIGFLGFEAGLVLNDIVDGNIDKKETQTDKLTKYWRVFGRRPVSEGLISPKNAAILFVLLVAITTALIFSLPSFTNALYVVTIMVTCYCLEAFYQIKKRNQNHPIAQLIGRIDFTLFPLAGYLCVGQLDSNLLLFALFFYPIAQAHLGLNDLIDVKNDKAKQMKTIPVLYGMKKTTYWILGFTIIHFITTAIFLTALKTVAIVGFAIGFTLLIIANYRIQKEKTADVGIKVLPLFHVALLVYSLSIILQYFI